ncbi:hypothetical protein BH20ACI1_BH20ACI1_25960 [soil metagenome]
MVKPDGKYISALDRTEWKYALVWVNITGVINRRRKYFDTAVLEEKAEKIERVVRSVGDSGSVGDQNGRSGKCGKTDRDKKERAKRNPASLEKDVT